MATFELYPISVERTPRNVQLLKTLGTLGLVGSPMMLAGVVATGLRKAPTATPLVGLFGVVYCVGWLASLAGLHLTGAMGRDRLGRGLLGVQAGLVLLAGSWSAGEALVPGWDGSLLLGLGDAAWPLSHLLMVVLGVVALREERWPGWAAAAPVLCGLALPFAFLSNLPAWERSMALGFGLWTCAAFALLAYAVRTSGTRLPAD